MAGTMRVFEVVLSFRAFLPQPLVTQAVGRFARFEKGDFLILTE
jgi:hypothetical protein